MSETMTKPDNIFGAGDIKEIVWLELEQVQPDPRQPRQEIDEESLDELAASIKAHGLMQPITVRPNPEGEGYLIIMGERRLQACKRLGWEKIEGMVLRNVSEPKAFELALIENVQRVDLPPLDVAAGYERLIKEFGLTQEQVAEQVGVSRTSVTNLLALNRLPVRIRQEARQEKLAKSKLIELAQLSDEKRQLELWEKLKKGISIGEAREAKKQGKDKPKAKATQSTVEKRKALSQAVALGRKLTVQVERIDIEFLRGKPREQQALAALVEQLTKTLHAVQGNGHDMDELTESEALLSQDEQHVS
jgi:ParB family transcriptional regulator, chromosome partitioning protein